MVPLPGNSVTVNTRNSAEKGDSEAIILARIEDQLESLVISLKNVITAIHAEYEIHSKCNNSDNSIPGVEEKTMEALSCEKHGEEIDKESPGENQIEGWKTAKILTEKGSPDWKGRGNIPLLLCISKSIDTESEGLNTPVGSVEHKHVIFLDPCIDPENNKETWLRPLLTEYLQVLFLPLLKNPCKVASNINDKGQLAWNKQEPVKQVRRYRGAQFDPGIWSLIQPSFRLEDKSFLRAGSIDTDPIGSLDPAVGWSAGLSILGSKKKMGKGKRSSLQPSQSGAKAKGLNCQD